MRETWTTGLLVLKVDGVQSARVLFERYRLGNDVNSRCMSWSVGKSILSALFGVACSEGLIGDINVKTVTDYLPQLQGTAYEGVRLNDILQMSSGIKFGEEYSSPFSDINRMGYSLAFGWSIESFIKSLKKRDHEPGTYNNYVSMDSQVLGLVLAQVVRARGYTLSSYLEEKIWSKAGFQANATWWLDNDKDQMELAIGTLGITTRDYARFGWLFLNGGLSPATGDRLIAEEWVRASTTADAPHLHPGPNANAGKDCQFCGYGYQWWLPPGDDAPSGPCEAAGDYMVFVHVHVEMKLQHLIYRSVLYSRVYCKVMYRCCYLFTHAHTRECSHTRQLGFTTSSSTCRPETGLSLSRIQVTRARAHPHPHILHTHTRAHPIPPDYFQIDLLQRLEYTCLPIHSSTCMYLQSFVRACAHLHAEFDGFQKQISEPQLRPKRRRRFGGRRKDYHGVACYRSVRETSLTVKHL